MGRRFARQLRYAHAIEMAYEGVAFIDNDGWRCALVEEQQRTRPLRM